MGMDHERVVRDLQQQLESTVRNNDVMSTKMDLASEIKMLQNELT